MKCLRIVVFISEIYIYEIILILIPINKNTHLLVIYYIFYLINFGHDSIMLFTFACIYMFWKHFFWKNSMAPNSEFWTNLVFVFIHCSDCIHFVFLLVSFFLLWGYLRYRYKKTSSLKLNCQWNNEPLNLHGISALYKHNCICVWDSYYIWVIQL